MQNKPSQVKSWTTASCRIVAGISRIAAAISPSRGPSPRRPRRARSHAAGSSGGNSLVVTIVHSTARKNTTAPTWNECFTDSGTPLAVLPCTPNQLNTSGRALARLAPTPMKNDCITNPVVRWDTASLSATNARNGSIEMLMDASSIQSSVAAIHSALEVGMTNSAIDASTAPVRK